MTSASAAELAEPSRGERWLLAALLVAAFALRLWVAWPNPSPSRYNDERVAVETIERALTTGSLRPVSGYYLSLSYLPHLVVVWPAQRLHSALGAPTGVLDGQGRLNALGYRFCRLVQVVFGVVSIWAIWRVGRRLFSPPTGLLAAFLLAVVPWHVRQSAILKPDIALLLTMILAFWAALEAVERRTVGRYLLAGAAIGLCLSSKFNGAAAALPLTVGTLWTGRRDPGRSLGLLASAALVAAAVFAALNPFFFLAPDLFGRHFFGRTLTGYEWKAKGARAAHWEMPIYAVRSLVGTSFHGPLVGGLGVLALGAGLVRRVRERLPYRSPSPLAALLLASLTAGYLIAYSAVTRNPSDHNWVPLAPFVALAAAAALVTLGRRAPRWLAVAVLAALAVPAHRWAYNEAVPATPALARAYLGRALAGGQGRTVLSEETLELDTSGWSGPGPAPGQDGPLVLPVEDLARVDARDVAFADGLVFAAGRLVGPQGETYRRWLTESAAARPLVPRLGRRRGPELLVVTRPLELASFHDESLPAGERVVRVGSGVDWSSGPRLVSISVGGRFRRLEEAWIESDGVRHPCMVQWRRPPGRTTCRSARFLAAREPVLHLGGRPANDGRVRSFVWHRPPAG